MELKYIVNAVVRVVHIERDGEAFRVSVDGGEEREVRVVAAQGTSMELDLFGARLRGHVVRESARRLVALGADTHEFAVAERGKTAQRKDSAARADDLTAPMPGQVIAVTVAPGDAVERGETLVVLEAMKMELRVVAPHDGTVQQVLASVGQVVERGQRLIELAA